MSHNDSAYISGKKEGMELSLFCLSDKAQFLQLAFIHLRASTRPV
jgi:hypothetical protein